MSLSSKRRNTGPDQKTRDLVYGRDGMHCVVCGDGYELQIHHRSARRAGGTSRPEVNSPANLILLCPDCHRFAETNREQSLDRGLLVSSWQTPSEVALIRHGEWGRLDDDGGWTPCAEPTR